MSKWTNFVKYIQASSLLTLSVGEAGNKFELASSWHFQQFDKYCQQCPLYILSLNHSIQIYGFYFLLFQGPFPAYLEIHLFGVSMKAHYL